MKAFIHNLVMFIVSCFLTMFILLLALSGW